MVILMNSETLLKALSLEYLTNWIVRDTPHNRVLIEKIDELNDEFEQGDATVRTSILARVYDLALGLEVI